MPRSNDRALRAMQGFLQGFGGTLQQNQQNKAADKRAAAAQAAAVAEAKRKEQLTLDKEIMALVGAEDSPYTSEDYENYLRSEDPRTARLELLRSMEGRRGNLLQQAADANAQVTDFDEKMTLNDVQRAATQSGLEYMTPGSEFGGSMEIEQFDAPPPPGVSSGVSFDQAPPGFEPDPGLGPVSMNFTAMNPMSGGAGPVGDRILAQRWEDLPSDPGALGAAARGEGPFADAPKEFRDRAAAETDVAFRNKARGDYKLRYNEGTGMIEPSDYGAGQDLSESEKLAKAYYLPTQRLQGDVGKFEDSTLFENGITGAEMAGLWGIAEQSEATNPDGSPTTAAQGFNLLLGQTELGSQIQQYRSQMTALVQNISFALSGKQASAAEIQQRMRALAPRAGDSAATVRSKREVRQRLIDTIQGMYASGMTPEQLVAEGAALDGEDGRQTVDDLIALEIGAGGSEPVKGADGIWR